MKGLELKNIYKIYDGNVTAVENFNLKIEDKEFIVFVGPSGCGKSTTLRMIAGLEEISKGELYIDGVLVNEVTPKDRDIAMVFQNYALYPHMTVYDNMSFALKIRKASKSEIDEKVREAAKILDITHLLDRKPKALSGGQRQRVAMGRAIVREPKVFLMDEPLSNLDAKLRVQMRTEIAKLHKRLATTFIYVTHDQTEAMTLGTRIVVMKDGIVQQVATPKEIYENPVNLFVAGFIGSPQINSIKGMIQEERGTIKFVFGEDKIVLNANQGNLLKSRGYVGKEAIIGIRPENIIVKEELLENHMEQSLIAHVEVVENMGSESYLYFSKGEDSIRAKMNGIHGTSTGEDIRIAFNVEKIHMFDSETELTIF
jgi:multiple sugar transport system ATP-binding protein